MPEAADDQVGPSLEAPELTPGEAMQIGDGVGQGILHGTTLLHGYVGNRVKSGTCGE